MLKRQYRLGRLAPSAPGNTALSKSRREYNTIMNLIEYFYPQNTGAISTSNFSATFGERCILDIGCGDEYLRHGFEENSWKYHGIDFDTCDVERDLLPYEDKSFDIVSSLAVIEHLHDPSVFISEAKRVCKAEGIVILSTPNWQYCTHDFYDDPTHIRPYTPIGLKSMLQLAGFKDIRIVPNLRCKHKRSYTGRLAFLMAALLPFRSDCRYGDAIPEIIKGKARGIFAICLNN